MPVTPERGDDESSDTQHDSEFKGCKKINRSG